MKTIGIISLKGGVGKTSVVSSLGSAIAGFGKKVLLIDGNFSAGNLGLHLNVIDSEITIHNILNGTANAKNAICKLADFDIIPSSVSNKININPLKLKNKISSLKKKYDVIIIDSSPSLNEETLAVMLASDELLVVTTPDYPTLSTTIKSIQLAKKRGISIDGLIINKVHNKNFELSLKELENTAEIPVMAVLPYDINVLKALSKSVPFTNYKPKSKAGLEYKKLAGTLIGENCEPVRLKKLLKWVNPKKQEINREIFYQRVFR